MNERFKLWGCVLALIIRDNKILMILRKNKPDAGNFNLVGGRMEENETVSMAIIREIKEELGLSIEKSDILFIGSTKSTNIKDEIINNHFNEYYIINKDVDISNLSLQEEEVSEVKWVEKNDIINRVINNYDGITNKEGCWEYLLKYYEWLDKNPSIT